MKLVRIIPWLSIFFFSPFLLFAQNCGCYDCNISIPVNSLDTFEYVFSDVVVDDLSDPSQGICGIEIHFNHRRVCGLEITLISPSGQSIQLIGPNLPNPTVQTTFGTSWDIMFVRSIDPANPDPGISSTWSNAENWLTAGRYTGTYYPRQGNLEDFNTGPVNGTWRLVIQNFNSFSSYFGEIIDFRIILCNPDGIECCFADGGEPSGSSNLNFCESDTALLLNPTVTFGGGGIDTTVYDFTWIISQNQIILEYDTFPDLRAYPVGNYELCGFGYQIEDVDSLPVPDGILRVDTLRNFLNVPEPPWCGDVSNDCISVSIHAPPGITSLKDTICIGEFFEVGDSSFFNPGNYSVSIPLNTGCDSVVNLDLMVLIPDTTFLFETICHDSTFTVGDSIYSENGVYINSFSTSNFCDSLVKLELTVLLELITEIDSIICLGDTVSIGNSKLTETGIYEIHTSSINNCDSLIRVDLTVLNPDADIAVPDSLFCHTTQIVLDGSNSSPANKLNFIWWTDSGTILSSATEPQITVADTGFYFLRVRQDSLGVSCFSGDTIQVWGDFEIPEIVVVQPDTLFCNPSTVILDGSGSSFGNIFEYQWTNLIGSTPPGATGNVLTVSDPGDYRFVVSNTYNGCSDSVEVLVVQDTIAPIAEAGAGFELNCLVFQDTLNGIGTSTGIDFSYNWSGPGIVCCETTLAPVIDVAGNYELVVTNDRNGCISNDSVLVTQNDTMPYVEAGIPDTLNCRDLDLLLNGQASMGNDIVYLWSTIDGYIVRNETSLQPTIDAPGTYHLSVFNQSNFCGSTDSVEIVEDMSLPVAEAGGGILNCRDAILNLGSGITSSGPNFIYQWYEGNLAITGADSSTIQVDHPGLFILEVQNTRNFCSIRDTASIAIDTIYPISNAGDDAILTCTIDSVTLDGSGSSIGPNFIYSWITDDGCFNSSDLAQPTVIAGCAGTYILNIENSINGCISIDSVEVTTDDQRPDVFAGQPDTLNCVVRFVTLNGSSNPLFQEDSILWTTIDGHILNGETTLNPVVDTAGTYTLTVIRHDNNCDASASVKIDEFVDIVIADAGQDQTLNCFIDTVTLQGANNSSGRHNYQWMDEFGTPIPGANAPTFQTSNDGFYILSVIDTVSLCSSLDTVYVDQDTLTPIANAGESFQLDCQTKMDTLRGGSSSVGIEFFYNWTTINGNIVTGGDTPNPLIDTAGVYYLTVLNAENHCTATDSVIITQDGNIPNATAPDSVFISCDDGIAVINALPSSSGINFVYNWHFPDGSILQTSDSLELSVDNPGHYLLEVIDTSNNCIDSTEIEVFDVIYPIADAGDTIELDCFDWIDGRSIGGSSTSVGPNYSYSWITFNGRIISRTDTITPVIDLAGFYEFTVTNNLNNCTATDAIWVVNSPNNPLPDAGPNLQVPCEDSTAVLYGSNSSPSTDVIFEWSTITGNILSPTDRDSILVDSSAWYFLEVTDTISGCPGIDSVNVQFLPCGPNLVLHSPDTVNCLVDTVRLAASGFEIQNVTIKWETIEGQILKDSLTSTPLVTAGVFHLTVVDTTVGISDTAIIRVPVDTLLPVAEAGTPKFLTCQDQNVALDGSGSSLGSKFSYQWTPNLNVLNPNSLTPIVSNGGLYNLTVTNIRNHCKSSDTVSVYYDTISPIANAGVDLTFPCDTPFIRLDGSGTDFGPGFMHQWSTGDFSLTPPVQNPGTYCITVTNQLNGCESFDCVEVIADQDAPDVEAGDTMTLTCRDTIVNLQGIIDTGDLSFVWRTNNGCIISDTFQLSIDVNCTGIYELIVTDNSNNCTNQDFVIVEEDKTLPIAEAGLPEKMTCNDTIVKLNGEASSSGTDFSYLWQGPCIIGDSSYASVEVCQDGYYFLTVTDNSNGCDAKDSVIVGIDTIPPSADAGQDHLLTCAIPTVQLNGLGSSRDSQDVYLWTAESSGSFISGETTLSPIVDSPDIYVLTVIDTLNGCRDTSHVEVLLNNTPPEFILDSTNNFLINCYQDTFELDASLSQPQGDLVFSWNTFDGNILTTPVSEKIVVDKGGWYFVSLGRTDNGCSLEDSVFVESDTEKPQVSFLDPNPITCDSISVLLGGLPPPDVTSYNSIWNTVDGNILQGESTLTPRVNRSARYTLIITNLNNGCENNGSVFVPIDTISPTADANVTEILDCFNTTINLDGTGSSNDGHSFEYLWTTSGTGNIQNDSTLTPTIDAPGFYQILVRNIENGCKSIDSVEVDENAIAIDSAYFEVQPITCFQYNDANIQIDSITGGTPPFVYSLSGGPFFTFSEFSNLTPGRYDLLIQDINGCEWDTVIIIDESKEFLVEIGPDVTLQLGDSAEINALINIPVSHIDTILWNPEDLVNCPGCQTQYLSPQITTAVSVLVQDINGCRAWDDLIIHVVKERPVYIPNIFSPNDDGNNDIFLVYGGIGIVKIDQLSVFDRWGNIVFQASDFQPNNPNFGWDGTFKGQRMNSAVFVYKAKITFADGKTETFTGDVTLWRRKKE